MTEDRTGGERAVRRLIFLVDPQRRSSGTSLWVNPVMVKEFRSRRFGRSHWTLRLIALCAILSLGLSYVAASGALGWGIEFIGGSAYVDGILETPFALDADGMLPIPDAPGLGVKLDSGKLARYTPDPAPLFG